jgi:hypothetical protein
MAKGGKTLSYTFRGSQDRIKKLQDIIKRALESAVPKIDPGGPVENWGQSGGWVQDIRDHWGQSGGWYLVIGNEKPVKVSRPDKSVVNVTKTVYEALSKAKQRS